MIEVAHQDIKAHCHSGDWQISSQRPRVDRDGRLELIDSHGERRYKQAKVFVAQARHCGATTVTAAPDDSIRMICS
ncbi:MAG: hypothetical protein GY861_25000 [bacterium]|nr:hypothetical protein [bacterium]